MQVEQELSELKVRLAWLPREGGEGDACAEEPG